MAVSRGLGKGLDALFQKTATSQEEPQAEGSYHLLPLEAIEANPQQPRKSISQDALRELAQSIQQQGLLQPVLVRPVGRDAGRYQIVAGERRWRACTLAGLGQIPCIVTELSDAESLVIGLIENLQREDLNPMEESEALQRLILELEVSQEALAERIGRSRSSIANSLRLLQLEEEVQDAVRDGRLATGQARTLLAVDDPEARKRLFALALQERLTVRDLEDAVAYWKEQGHFPLERSEPQTGSRRQSAGRSRSGFLRYKRRLQEVLADRFSARVKITGQGDKGSISFQYRSEEELRDILSRMGVDQAVVSRETP